MNIIKGKLPPQAIDLEEAVLGAMMIDKRGFEDIKEVLKSQHFYKPQHVLICEAIIQLGQFEQNIDLLTVSQQLRKNGNLDLAGGDIYLIELTQKVSSSAHIENHYKIIQQKYLSRQIINLSNNYIDLSYNDTTDVFELLNEINKDFENIENETETEQMPDINSQVNDINFNKNAKDGLKSSIKEINLQYGEWQRGDLIIIAGRPGMGKSSLIIPEIIHALNNNETICLFSLEMSAKACILRLASFLTGIDFGLMIRKQITKEQQLFIHVAFVWLKSKKLFIFDKSYTKEQIKIKCEKIKKKHGLDRVYIDHLGIIILPKGNNKNDKIGQVSNDLKRFAKILNVPVFALCQLSRDCEKRGGMKRPILSDLRDSGEIEQDADVVIFAYRPEYYKIEFWDDETQTQTINQIELNFAKNRNGKVDSLRLNCFISTQRIGRQNYFEFEELGQKILNYKTKIKETPINENYTNIKPATPQDAFDNNHFI